jgi:hypothetical protein
MIKSKKQMFLVIAIFTLVIMLGTVSYAFFNYTRTGAENTVRVGRLSFVTNQTRTITLTDVFPIDSSNVNSDTDNVGEVVITISGDTDYVNGIEYLVSTEDVHIYTSEGKIVPVSLDVTVSGLGDESSTYFTSRNSKNTTIYKKLSGNSVVGEQQLLVGYIKPNTVNGTAEGINGSIRIKAYFDNEKIAITDTLDESEEWVDGRTYITSSEWNSLSTNGVTFKVRVEANTGIWVNEPFYDVMQRSTVMDNINSTYVNNSTPGIDFSKISSNTNGKGIYTRAGTENDTYPIMYYRGDVSDNNVLFGNKCWKIIRTTDTGGIKMIYNGNPVNNQCGNDRVLEKNQIIKFNIDTTLFTTDFSDGYEYDSVNKVFVLTNNVNESTMNRENVDGLIGKYLCNVYKSADRCASLLKVVSYDSTTGNVGFTQITQDSSIILNDNDPNKDNIMYNVEYLSPASMGYMYGTNYAIIGAPLAGLSQSYFGSGFTYENGQYKLVDPIRVSWSEINQHRYSCHISDPDGTCESIRYYLIFTNTGQRQYILLSEGKSIEDAVDDMLSNTNDSLAKTMIETWYRDNMTDYTNKLEDTVYCNSRVIGDIGTWNSNNGDITNSSDFRLSFHSNGLDCQQKKDSFTVSSEKGNGKLNYQVGMVNYEEIELAGAIYGLENPNKNFYLYDGNGFWTMTPYQFDWMSYVGRLYDGGNSGGTRPDHIGYMSGFRPVISLKQGTGVISGNGTSTDPYVIK